MISSLECVSDHTFDPSLIRPGNWVLDGGCRDWKFAKRMVELGAKVLAVDPADDIVDPQIDGIIFERAALINDDAETALFVDRRVESEHGEANHLVRFSKPSQDARVYPVKTTTIGALMIKHRIPFFDLIKLDIEGAEYAILENLPSPIARQISVEFHEHLGMNPSPSEPHKYFERMMNRLTPWYKLVNPETDSMDCFFVRA